MKPYYEADGITFFHGDCRTVLSEMDADSIDACLTDPPYELGFMGKTWDNSGVAFDPATWVECLRVLKPGAHLLAFGGTRTFHRMTVAIEDAGFEIRDCLMWLYGSGFPKSLDVSKAIDKAAGAERVVTGQKSKVYADNPDSGGESFRYNAGGYSGGLGEDGSITEPATPEAQQWDGWGTALKPAWEPIILARKPLGEKTVAKNVLAYGTGAINIDATRIGDGGHLQWATPRDMGYHGGTDAGKVDALEAAKGRWPANVVLSHSPECREIGTKRVKGSNIPGRNPTGGKLGIHGVYGRAEGGLKNESYADADGYETVSAWECAPDCAVAMLDEQSGVTRPGHRPRSVQSQPGSGRTMGGGWSVAGDTGEKRNNGHNDSGGASRFFYTAKASREERSRGMYDFPKEFRGEYGKAYSAKTWIDRKDGKGPVPVNANLRPSANNHATVKPIALMKYLIRLIVPPGGVVVDPFLGSGSTMVACRDMGVRGVGIELEEAYCKIAIGRLSQRSLVGLDAAS